MCSLFVGTAVNKFSPAANTYDLGTTVGRATAVTIAGRLQKIGTKKGNSSQPNSIWLKSNKL